MGRQSAGATLVAAEPAPELPSALLTSWHLTWAPALHGDGAARAGCPSEALGRGQAIRHLPDSLSTPQPQGQERALGSGGLGVPTWGQEGPNLLVPKGL